MKKLHILLLLPLIFAYCNKGLSPTGIKSLPESEINFPIEVLGGNLMGAWQPIDDQALEAGLVNPEALSGMVDSLVLNSLLNGSVIFEQGNKMTFDSLLIQIYPDVYVGGVKIPISPFVEFIDTTITYEQPWKNVIIAPVKTMMLKIDTLGYTANEDSLELITKPSGFPGFEFAEYYLHFKFKRK